MGRYEYVLKNLYVYFWRWAFWKVFEDSFRALEGQPDSAQRAGVVCFITASGYLNGPGFAGMREYIRRSSSRGWIINVTPEGKRPPAKNAVFAIETPVSIALFLREEDTNEQVSADIRYVALHGTYPEKCRLLQPSNWIAQSLNRRVPAGVISSLPKRVVTGIATLNCLIST